MIRFISFVAVLAVTIGFQSDLSAQEIQRGKLKSIDVVQKTIVITTADGDVTLTLTDSTQVLNATGTDLAEKLKDFKPGSELNFRAVKRDGKDVAQGLRLIPAGQPAGQPPAAGGPDGPRRAKVKKVDPDDATVTLTVGDRDLEVIVTDRTDLRGSKGDTIAEKLKSFPVGTDVMFASRERDGKQILMGMMTGQGPAAGGQNNGKPVSPDHAHLKPLDELGTSKYQGFVGGFYPDGQNRRPARHEAAGLALAAKVQPRNAAGQPDPNGKVVLLSIGMSNTSQSSQGFQEALSRYEGKNPSLVFVNGAQGGMTAFAIQNPNDGGRGTTYWNEVDQRLKQSGVTREQVQAIWIKQADAGPRDGFPAYAQTLQSELTAIVHHLAERFPNARLCYLSSRTYGGYATTSLNPEPYAYESAFAVKWLIEEQIKGNPTLRYADGKEPVVSPWLSWGPYLWANGATARTSDGFHYEATDFANDGTHHSPAGSRKVGTQMLEFFKNDSTSKPWFNKP